MGCGDLQLQISDIEALIFESERDYLLERIWKVKQRYSIELERRVQSCTESSKVRPMPCRSCLRSI